MMLDDFNYDTFVSCLKEELISSDHDEVNDLEFLIDYYKDYPPSELEDPDSDFSREEIERLAQEQLPKIKRYLMEKENYWLIVDVDKFKEGKSTASLKSGSPLEQKLTVEEQALINTHFQELGIQERRNLLNLYEQKVSRLGNNKEKFDVLKSLCNSYKYSSIDDSNYLRILKNTGDLALELNESDGFKYFEYSAKIYRERYEHDDSAEQFRLAIVAANKAGERKEEVLVLTRSMRIQYELAGNEEKAAIAFVEENKLKRVICGKPEVGILHRISDYCQNPEKVALGAGFLILFSTLVYAIFGLVPSGFDKQSLLIGDETCYRVLWDSLYFSIVTFTTLGYGDFSPSDGISRIMANIQSLGGLFFTSLFLVTLVKKYGR
ncbi:two pore domain potassium channel family protein [Aliivibrio fischeri]|uniref:potassium channel family protein n=1 Tax=Aliivibrio fischeri TaxID=668 RepID=UPI0012D9A43D|nr:potassium channel family protein [Aliivibrio fischeri]MUL03294.1 two pore domain potassium channel family protein [Aliivibrio fischeri]